jgi:hypothetical protein
MRHFTAIAAGPLLTVGIAAAAITPAAPGASASSVPHLRGGSESSLVRPSYFNPIVNDGAATVVGLHWSRWSGTARGTGGFFTHNCMPNCAQGKTRDFPVRVSAWRVRHGDYTRFQYHFTRSIPGGQWWHGPRLPRTWTIQYSNGSWHGKHVV